MWMSQGSLLDLGWCSSLFLRAVCTASTSKEQGKWVLSPEARTWVVHQSCPLTVSECGDSKSRGLRSAPYRVLSWILEKWFISFYVHACSVTSVISDSFWLCDAMDCSPPGFSARGDSLGKNTGVGCQALLQEIFLTQGLNPCLLCFLHWRGPQGSSVPGISQARILEWVAISFSREDSLLLGHQKSPHLVPDILLNALHALSHLIFYTT